MSASKPATTGDFRDGGSESVVGRGHGRAAIELGLIGALWKRDLLRLSKERSRWIGVAAQPLLLWLLLGSGMASTFQIAGSDVDYLNYFFPGVCAMVVLFTTIFATMAVIEDRREGFLQQVLVSPGSRLSMVVGKCCGVTTVALLQVLLCVLVAPAAGYDLASIHWPMLLAATVLGGVGLTGLSFMFAWVINSTHGYHALMAMVLLPLWLVSGAMFPVSGGWLGAINDVNPMSYVVDALRHALEGGQCALASSEPVVALVFLGGFALIAPLGASWIAISYRKGV
jgi:ABC-2 type transport system permease protein